MDRYLKTAVFFPLEHQKKKIEQKKKEIEAMKADAEAHAAEDEKKLELVNKKNAADGQCFAIEKAMKDAGDKLSVEDKTAIETAIKVVREAIKTDNIENIDHEVKHLTDVWEPIVKKLYPQGQDANGQPQFSKEQMEQMMKDPKFAQMFGSTGGPFPGANTFTENQTKTNNDGTVDAEVVN